VTVTLAKGGNLVLQSEAPGIEQVRVGLGWTTVSGAQGSGPQAFEIDGIVSLVGEGSSAGRLLLAHQVPNPEESVTARPAAASPPVGDAEKLVVTLAAVPSSVSRVLFGAAIYDAAGRRQTFRAVRGAYVRVLNHANGLEIARYTLDVETGSETAMIFGELYRNPRGWKFRAVGQGYADGLRGIAGGTGEPAVARPVDVTGFLQRISPARSRRSFAEHLHPQRPATPPPPPPAPAKPSTPSAAPAQPRRQSLSAPTRPPSGPSTPQSTPQKSPPRPATRPTKPARSASPPTAGRSALDLSEPDERPAPAAGSAQPPVGRRPGAVVFGEHSSRFRQRAEHVAALDDEHPATTWTEEDRGTGAMTITLHWEPLKTSSGLPRPSDLHLGAFWQAADRSGGVLQTLGNAISAPGAAGPRQVLRLGRRDEREGHTIFVDLATLPAFRRFFVFAYGQHGSPEWSSLRPVLTVAAPTGEQVAMRFGDAPPSARLCVIASFHVVDGDLILRRENDYLDGMQADAAGRYGWQLDWNPDGATLRTSAVAT
jgi:stress response protein SCP2/uncharacterized protein involved in tellurium resistance